MNMKVVLENVYIIENIEYGISTFIIGVHPKFANTEDHNNKLRKALKGILEKKVKIIIELQKD